MSKVVGAILASGPGSRTSPAISALKGTTSPLGTPEVLATGGERAACHVDQILGLRCGELGRAALRSAGRDLCEDLGDVCYCDGLDEERGGTVATPPLRVQPTTIPAKS